MRFALAGLALAAVAVAIVMPGPPEQGTPLWPGARHTREERDRAVFRGLDFIYLFARNEVHFRDWGHDLLAAFYNIAETSADPELRRLAWRMGHERALEWRRLHRTVAANAGPDEVATLISGLDVEERLGVPNARLRALLRHAAARFSGIDYMWFDPVVEPPPADVPKACSKCGRQNARGATVCSRCGTKLEMQDPYDLFQDALINTYTGERAGIMLGAHYADVLKWLPAMRPWPTQTPDNYHHYYAGVYAITHVIYTYNDYSQARVSADCFPTEFAHLQANLREAIVEKDPETMGEYLDSLRSFGMNFRDGLIRDGFDYLLSVQNADGSWGDMKDPDPYGRYHPTWTAVDGLREYRWSKVLPCPAISATKR